MLGVIFRDISQFIVVMAIVVLGFSNYFYFALKNTSEQKSKAPGMTESHKVQASLEGGFSL